MSLGALFTRHVDHAEHTANVSYGHGFVIAWLIGLCLIATKNMLNSRIKKRLGYNLHPPGYIYLIPWAFILLVFCYYRTPDSLNGISKRLGRITYAIIPLSVILSLRPSPLPSTYYIPLLEFHKWVSRTAVLLGATHGVTYLIYLIQAGKGAKIAKWQNLLGIFMLVAFLVMFFTSLRPFRTRFYSIFYRIHYLMAWFSVVAGIFHARPGVAFLAGWTIFTLISAIVYRLIISKTISTSEVEYLSPTLLYITLPRSTIGDFTVGSHIRLSNRLFNPLTWISSSHPYSIASLPSDGHLKLLIRKTRFDILANNKYSLSGPYKSPLEGELVKAKKLLFYAGGSGLSVAAPMVRFIELRKSAVVKLIWVTRDVRDLAALDRLNVDHSLVDVYITGAKNNSYESDAPRSPTTNAGEDYSAIDGAEGMDEDAIEFDNLQPGDHLGSMSRAEDGDSDEEDLIVSDNRHSGSRGSTALDDQYKIPDGLLITYGRPNIQKAAGDFFDLTDHGSLTAFVMACGPRKLVDDVQTWANQKRYQFYGEKFAL